MILVNVGEWILLGSFIIIIIIKVIQAFATPEYPCNLS